MFSFANWFAPAAVSLIGPRLTLVGGGICYCLFIAQLVYPNNGLLYAASALIGLGAAAIWVAQGNFLTLNSDARTNERNSGIFWAMLQCSLLIGNTFVYFQFLGLQDIDKTTRTTVSFCNLYYFSFKCFDQQVALVLLTICIVGTLCFFLLRPTPWASGDSTANESPAQAFRSAFRLLCTLDMLQLIITFSYTGLVLTFWSGVYGTCIGFTKAFGEAAKSLVGLHGIVVGVGEIVGGLTFGIFGPVLTKHGRHWPVLLGFVVHIAAFAIAFVNLPADAPFEDTDAESYIDPNPYLAVVGSFSLGLGDACFNTQIYAIIGGLYKDNSAPAFAIFKFFQSALAAAAFYYSSALLLPYQLLFLTIFCVLGTATFVRVEFKARRQQRGGIGVPGNEDPGVASGGEDTSCGIATNQPLDQESPKA